MYTAPKAISLIRSCALLLLLGGLLLLARTSSTQVADSPLKAAPSAGPTMVGQSAVRGHVNTAQATGGDNEASFPATGTDSEVRPPDTSESAAAAHQPKTSFEILIGPGDLIEVSVYGASDYVKEVRVLSTGEIALPMAGMLKVGGLTPAQAEDLIAKRLKEGDYFTDPRVSVIEKETATQGISVLGEVQKPGVYPLPGPRRLFDAISAAGGTTPRAGNTVSIMHRADPQQSDTVKLSYGHSSNESNVYVYPGDTIVVSKAGVVYVVGDVRLPGGFVMENSRMTILQAYAMAQGANGTAALDRAQLIRKSGSADQIISLKKILTAKAPDMELQPEDILFVPTSSAKVAGRRTIDAIVQTASGMAIYSRVP